MENDVFHRHIEPVCVCTPIVKKLSRHKACLIELDFMGHFQKTNYGTFSFNDDSSGETIRSNGVLLSNDSRGTELMCSVIRCTCEIF